MPEQKKPSRPSKPPSKAQSRYLSQRQKSTRPASRATGSPRARGTDEPPEQDEEQLGLGAEPDEEEAPVGAFGSRPIAVGRTETPEGGEIEGPAAGEPAETGSALATEERPPADVVIERPLVELAVGAVGALLAASVLVFNWYTLPVKTPVSGWASGRWGPVIFFLGVAVVVIIVLRRLRVPVAFPFETSTVIEGIGYLSVAMLLMKRFFIPAGWSMEIAGWFVSIILSAALFLLAGMMSSSAPLVIKPGWLRGPGGALGVLILVLALGAGAAFGFTNDPPGPKPPKACGEDFPLPTGVKRQRGIETPTEAGAVCYMIGTIPASLGTAIKRFDAALTRKGWNHRERKRTEGGSALAPGNRVIQIRDADVCGAISVSRKGNTTSYVVIYGGPKSFGSCQNLPIG